MNSETARAIARAVVANTTPTQPKPYHELTWGEQQAVRGAADRAGEARETYWQRYAVQAMAEQAREQADARAALDVQAAIRRDAS
ncbi:hypothetical protein [Curtobacterium sp. MCBD17_003]|uniref:hypothetical protein n=1 Tax=Curtobacterium sp. MCBD17_003 TaxID=2175667 RepID=UPI000DAA7C88|nr:hypothetical protein [Curtobacterium sp. MCBD17_003]WIE53437.1 hypothetical protein DEI88_009715 [Curtobacterium sp. MCBD17_003]